MILSPLEIFGASKKNGFPIVVGRIEANHVTGQHYRSFNEQLALAVMAFKEHGMINLILISENPDLKLPTPAEIKKALKTKEGKFLEEMLREMVLVGFQDKAIHEIAAVGTKISGTKVTAVNSLQAAYAHLGLRPT